MPVTTTFSDDTILYAANLNSAFGQAVTTAGGDIIRGALTTSGQFTANGITNYGMGPGFGNGTGVDSILLNKNQLNNYSVHGFETNMFYTMKLLSGNFSTGNNDYGYSEWDWVASSTVPSSVFVNNGSNNPNPTGRWHMRLAGKVFTPEMFGAAGDGVTDDWVALTNAFNALGNSGNTAYQWPGVINGATMQLTPGKMYYIGGGPNMANASAWAPNTVYANGSLVYNNTVYYNPAQANGAPFFAGNTVTGSSNIVLNNGNIFQCIQPGTSAITSTGGAPLGPAGLSNNIIDGTCVWKNIGNGNLKLGGAPGVGNIIDGGRCPISWPTTYNNTFANSSGFILHPAVSLQVGANCLLRNSFIISLGAYQNATPNANSVIQQVQQWANNGSVGVYTTGGAGLEKLMIVGFNTCYRNNGCKYSRDLMIDGYNGVEVDGLGDIVHMENIMMEPWYRAITGFEDPGVYNIPNGFRPGIGMNVHDRADGDIFINCYAFNYLNGFRFSNVYCMCDKLSTDFDGTISAAVIAAGYTPIALRVTQDCPFIDFHNCQIGGVHSYFLWYDGSDAGDIPYANLNNFNGQTSGGIPNGIHIHGGKWGAGWYLGPYTRTAVEDVTINYSGGSGPSNTSIFQVIMDDNIRKASFKNMTYWFGGGNPLWYQASPYLLQSKKLTIDGVHHTDTGVFTTTFSGALRAQKHVFSENPGLYFANSDPLMPGGIISINSTQPYNVPTFTSNQPNANNSRNLSLLRNWAEVGYIETSNKGMTLNTNNSIYCVTNVSVATPGTGYIVNNVVPLKLFSNLSNPGQNACVLVTGVYANGGIANATVYMSGSYSSNVTGVVNASNIVSSLLLTNPGLGYTNSQFTVVVSNNSPVLYGSAGFVNANGSLTVNSITNLNPLYSNELYPNGIEVNNPPIVTVISKLFNGNVVQASYSANIGSGAQFNIISVSPNVLGLNPSGDTVSGPGISLAQNSTSGFLYIPTISGQPTGTPLNSTKGTPLAFDPANNKVWFYNGTSWKGTVIS